MNTKLAFVHPNAIRYYRRRLNLRTKDLAAIVGCDPSSIGSWEHGHKTPTLSLALAISAAVQCPLEILYLEQFLAIRKQVRRRTARILSVRNPNFRSLPYWHEETRADAGR